MTNTTELYQKHIAAEKAMIEGNYELGLCDVADKAFAAYLGKIAELRAKWRAIPDGERKWSAEQNAIDTEDTDIDELRWLEVALMTYDLNGVK